MSKPWVIGVLSTDYDLHEYRQEIIETIKKDNIIVSAFELPDFPVEPDVHSHESCLIALRRTDISLLVIDKRYGGIFYDSSETSITQKEYLETVKKGNPALVFISKKAWDERYDYNKQLKYSGKTQNEFDKTYKCSYVENVGVIHFIDTIQKSYDRYKSSNWISYYNSISDLKKEVVGKLEGLSRYFLNRVIYEQAKKLESRKTSTGLSMSLGDVFKNGYYINPLYEITSGNISNAKKSLDKKIVDAIYKNDSILVVGEAGYGKTTILAKSFLYHTNMLRKSPEYKMPFYIWLKEKRKNYHFSLKEYLDESFEDYMQKRPYPYLNIESITPYFYVDGFDEMAEKLTTKEVMDIVSSEIFSYTTFLTCRKQYAYRYINNTEFLNKFNVVINVKSWDEKQAKNYIENFCIKKGKNKEYIENISKLLINNKELKSILNSPLLVTMLLWIIETKRMSVPETIHNRVELFKECLNEIAKRELIRIGITEIENIELVMEWSYFAWELYYNKLLGSNLYISDLIDRMEKQNLNIIQRDKFRATLETLFETDDDNVYGTFHEQFLEFLVANALHTACINKDYPYPIFLQYVIRPEINRYFRTMWNNQNAETQNEIVKNLWKQYQDNLGMESFEAVSKRVHAIYHISRFRTKSQQELIDRAFNIEKHISVILSLYFGAIKLGDLNKENEFCNLLKSNLEYSSANRGYHLAYYSDSIMVEELPFIDNKKDVWKGTLAAFIRHFESSKKEHYFLRRIDIITMETLILERNSILPLNDEIICEFERAVFNPPLSEYPDLQKNIEIEFEELKKKYNELKTSE